jgi:NADH-quinone oxidoreductase subunit M
VSQLEVIAVGIPVLGAGAIGLASCFALDLRTRHGKAAQTRTTTFRRIALAASVLTFGAVLCLTVVDWVLAARGITVGGGLGASFALLTSAVWLPAVFVGRHCDHKRPGLLYGFLLLLESAFLGVFVVDDAVLFCLSLEASTLLLYLLISGWGGPESDRIARKFLLFNLAADMLVLIALLGAVLAAGRMSAESVTGSSHGISYSISALTQDVPRLASDDIGGQEYWKHARRWLLTALILGLALKMPLAPFHTWFAPAVAEGPLCVGLAMLGAGLRVSTYAFVRFAGPLCGDLGAWSDLLVGLVVLGALHQSLLALAHSDMKKMTACASLSQASIAAAGFFSQLPAGTTGAVLLTIAGGLASTVLLFSFGFLEMQFHARDLSVIGGIWRRLPQVSCALLLAVLSLVGIPGLCGFTGLFPTLGGLFEFGWLSALLAMIAGLITAWALFWMLERIVFGPLRLPQSAAPADGMVAEAFTVSDVWEIASADPLSSPTVAAGGAASLDPAGGDGPGDLRRAEVLIIAPLVAGIILLGLRPQAIVDWISASLQIGSLSP